MNYHPVTKQIIDLLTKNNLWFEKFEHVPVRTSEEAAKVRHGYSLKQGAKALIVRVKRSETDKQFVMLVIPGDLRFDNKKLKTYFTAKDIRFATEEEISQLTNGVEIGGVPPLGNLFNLQVIIDPKVFENEKIIYNAGDRRFSVAMKSDDYKNLVNPVTVDIT